MMQFILPAVMSMAGSMMTNAMNRQNVSDTNALNEKLQREQWARDDTAYSRTVQDMQNAGLNPLQGVNPQSSPLSASMSAFQSENPLASLESLPQVFMAQKQFDLQNKALAVQAVKAGIDPKQLDNFTDKDLLNWYKNLVKFNATEAGKAAGSSSNRNSGAFGRNVNDLFEFLGIDKPSDSSSYSSSSPSSSSSKPSTKEKVLKQVKDFQSKQTKFGKKVRAALDKLFFGNKK